jgi:uncharacterized Fe-S cluster-containing radical SAM superfamily enzyme
VSEHEVEGYFRVGVLASAVNRRITVLNALMNEAHAEIGARVELQIHAGLGAIGVAIRDRTAEIGRASCRERV